MLFELEEEMDTKFPDLKKKIKALFTDPKVQEFDINYVLMWLSEAKEDEVIRVAHIAGGKRSDPDARSSAEAIATHMDHITSLFVEDSGKQVRFEHTFFGDGLDGPENEVFRSECKLNMVSLAQCHPENYRYILGYETSEIGEKTPRFNAVWDHHDKLPESKDTFADIRHEFNATAMIVSLYVRPFLNRTNQKHRLLATALRYGIISDLESSGEHKSSPEEEEIEKGLDEFTDHTILEKIRGERGYQTDFWSEFLPKAETKFFGSFALMGVGFIKASQERYMRILLNDLIRTYGVSTALCFGIVDNSRIVYKTRADDDSPISLRELDRLLIGNGDALAADKKSDSRKRAGGGVIRLCPKFREEEMREDDDKKEAERKRERPRKFYRNVFEDIEEMVSPILPSSTSTK